MADMRGHVQPLLSEPLFLTVAWLRAPHSRLQAEPLAPDLGGRAVVQRGARPLGVVAADEPFDTYPQFERLWNPLM